MVFFFVEIIPFLQNLTLNSVLNLYGLATILTFSPPLKHLNLYHQINSAEEAMGQGNYLSSSKMTLQPLL